MTIGNFLCRDDIERGRMRDVGARLRPGMPAIIACFVVAGVAGVPSYGWMPLLPPAVGLGLYGVLWLNNMPRRVHPEYAYVSAVLLVEVLMALATVVARGPRGYGFAALVMPLLFAAAALPRRVAFVLGAFASAVLVGVALAVDSKEVFATPPVITCGVFVLVSLTWTVMTVRDLDEDSRQLALVDELTHALNRLALAPRIAELNQQSLSSGESVSVIVGDVDHFKDVNDEHGHPTGDAVLQEIVRRLREALGFSEPVYRLGGEEFVILLPAVSLFGAQAVAETMRRAVSERPISGVGVTMSFGVAASPAEQSLDFDAVFARADQALYAAKHAGRDGVHASHAAADQSLVTIPVVLEGARGDGQRTEEREPATVQRPEIPESPEGGWTRSPATSVTGRAKVSDELEREHTLDLERRLAPQFRAASIITGLLILSAVPWFGWGPLIAPMIAALPYAALSLNADRFRHPERALGAGFIGFQTAIAIGFLSARGAPLFGLTLLVLMVPGPCALLPTRIANVCAAYTAVLIAVVGLILGGPRVLDNPAIVLFPIALLIEAWYLGSVIGRSAVGFRGAAVTDELTGLLTRTALNARARELEAQSETAARPVAILLADVDRFKTINDTEGHGRGDAVLREVASRLRGSLRSFESAYRLGGEEFLVLLPSADPGQAALVAERLRQSVRESPCAGVPVTISVGTATTTSGEPFRFKDVVDRADAALYRAKGTGRDRVCSDAGAKPADHPRPARTLTA